MFERLVRFWNALPGWLRTAIVVVLIIVFIGMPFPYELRGGGLVVAALATAAFTGISFAMVLRQGGQRRIPFRSSPGQRRRMAIGTP